MSVRVKDNTVFVEFSLSQPKRAWKLRSKNKRGLRGRFNSKRGVYKFTPTMGDVIHEGDVFEWMVNNEEVRDMLSALKCISPARYEEIKRQVYTITCFKPEIEKELGFGIKIEACYEPKQRKPQEKTPYLFVLFPMDKPTDVCYIVNKRDEVVKQPSEYKIKAGDRLVWIVKEEGWFNEIVITLAGLDNDHKNRVIKEVFEVIS